MIPYRIFNVMINPSNFTAFENEDDDSVSVCNFCNDKSADVFQVEGEYCLDCWQKKTCPDI